MPDVDADLRSVRRLSESAAISDPLFSPDSSRLHERLVTAGLSVENEPMRNRLCAGVLTFWILLLLSYGW